MAVYVDDMKAKFGQMIMCHMVSDEPVNAEPELHRMAQQIGVARRWHQKAGTYHSHYDICLAKRALAVKLGAIEITRKELGAILQTKRLQQKAIA